MLGTLQMALTFDGGLLHFIPLIYECPAWQLRQQAEVSRWWVKRAQCPESGGGREEKGHWKLLSFVILPPAPFQAELRHSGAKVVYPTQAWCVSYSSVVIKHHDQGNYRRESLFGLPGPWESYPSLQITLREKGAGNRGWRWPSLDVEFPHFMMVVIPLPWTIQWAGVSTATEKWGIKNQDNRVNLCFFPTPCFTYCAA